jgi:hypothetical protein
MAKLLKTDGEVIENVDISSLEKQQNLVGGYIQYVYPKAGKVLIVNEEGLLNQLPINDKASEVYGHPLVGDVIDCSVNELN